MRFSFKEINHFFLTLIIVTVVSVFSSALSASALLCSKVLHNKPRDSSIEIEIPLDINTLSSFTGVLREMFHRPSVMPQEVHDFIRARTSSILNFDLDKLPNDLKLKALQAGVANHDSMRGKTLRGIYVRAELQKKWDLLPYVEKESGGVVELHMRAAQRPGDLALHFNKFSKALGYKNGGAFHEHILFKFPREWLEENPLHGWQLFEFWRRLNIAFEMRDIFETGVSIRPSDLFFGFAGHAESTEVFRHLLRPEKYDLRSGAKVCWVGFRGKGTYDDPDAFGFELRSLDGGDLPSYMLNFLNSLPARVEQKNWGLEATASEKWLAKHGYEGSEGLSHLKDSPSSLIFNHFEHLSPHGTDIQAAINLLPAKERLLLMSLAKEKVTNDFTTRGRLRYLIHDWSQDPLFSEHPEKLKSLPQARLKAIRRWARGENERDVVQSFLLESGLLFEFTGSVGLGI